MLRFACATENSNKIRDNAAVLYEMREIAPSIGLWGEFGCCRHRIIALKRVIVTKANNFDK